MKKGNLFFLLFITGLFFFNSVSAQGGYIKLGDIKGESTDRDHKDWIVIESMSQGMAQQKGATGTARRRGTAVLEDITVTKRLDKSSPKLMEFCTKGQIIPEVVIEMTNAQRTSFYIITMKNVLVSSYSSSASCSGNCNVNDSFSLNYEEITWSYADPANPTGPRITTTWRVDKNM